MTEKRNRKKNPTRKCRGLCGEKKPRDAFRDELVRVCEDCRVPINDWSDSPDRSFARRIWFQYGITWRDYDKILEEQGGVCRICDTPPSKKRLDVDHDHSCCAGSRSCGRCVRGLICWRCNSVLGKVYDDPHLLRSMARYLEQ